MLPEYKKVNEWMILADFRRSQYCRRIKEYWKGELNNIFRWLRILVYILKSSKYRKTNKYRYGKES